MNFSQSHIENGIKLFLNKYSHWCLILFTFFAQGLVASAYKCIQKTSEIIFSKSFSQFNNVNDYIKEFSAFEDLTYNNFKTIFFLYFSIILLLFIIFIFDLILRTIIQLYRKLKKYLLNFLNVSKIKMHLKFVVYKDRSI